MSCFLLLIFHLVLDLWKLEDNFSFFVLKTYQDILPFHMFSVYSLLQILLTQPAIVLSFKRIQIFSKISSCHLSGGEQIWGEHIEMGVHAL